MQGNSKITEVFMSDTAINGGKGKQDNDSDEVRLGHPKSVIEDREKMEAELETKVIEPLALLAGVLAGVKEEERKGKPDAYEALNSVGYLLGLIVQGIRKEISFQVYGLDKAALMEMILQKSVEKGMFDKEGAE
jgi:hypothetical protein